jgi:hypothetical protein
LLAALALPGYQLLRKAFTQTANFSTNFERTAQNTMRIAEGVLGKIRQGGRDQNPDVAANVYARR